MRVGTRIQLHKMTGTVLEHKFKSNFSLVQFDDFSKTEIEDSAMRIIGFDPEIGGRLGVIDFTKSSKLPSEVLTLVI